MFSESGVLRYQRRFENLISSKTSQVFYTTILIGSLLFSRIEILNDC